MTAELPGQPFEIQVFSNRTGLPVWQFQTSERYEGGARWHDAQVAANWLAVSIPNHETNTENSGRIHLYHIPTQSHLHTFQREDPRNHDRFGKWLDFDPPYLIAGSEGFGSGFEVFRTDTFEQIVSVNTTIDPWSDKYRLGDGFAVIPIVGAGLAPDYLEIHDLASGQPPFILREPVIHGQSRLGDPGDIRDGILWSTLSSGDGNVAGFSLSDGSLVREFTAAEPGDSLSARAGLHRSERFLFYAVTSYPETSSFGQDSISVVDAETGVVVWNLPEPYQPPEKGSPDSGDFGEQMFSSSDVVFISGINGVFHAYALDPVVPLMYLESATWREDAKYPQVFATFSETPSNAFQVGTRGETVTAALGQDFPASMPPSTVPAGATSAIIDFALLDDSDPESPESFELVVDFEDVEISRTEIRIADDDVLQPDSELFGPNLDGDDGFGFSLAVSETRLVVGQLDDGGLDGNGQVFVYSRSTQLEERRFSSPNPAPRDYFGASVDIRDNVIAVGQPGDPTVGDQQGRVYLFDAATGTKLEDWREGSGSSTFGGELAFAGAKLVAADPGKLDLSEPGRIYFLDPNNGDIIDDFTAPDKSDGDFFGDSLATDDSMVVVGAFGHDGASPDAGRVFIYDPADCSYQGFIDAPAPAGSQGFGMSVALSATHILVADFSQQVHAFDRDTRAHLWSRTAAPEYGTYPDYGFSLAASGPYILVGAPGADTVERGRAGLVEILNTDGQVLGYLWGPAEVDDGDDFGTALALDNDQLWLSLPFSWQQETRSRIMTYDLSDLFKVCVSQWYADAVLDPASSDYYPDGNLDLLDYFEFTSPGYGDRFGMRRDADGPNDTAWIVELPEDVPGDVFMHLEASPNLRDWTVLYRYLGRGRGLGEPRLLESRAGTFVLRTPPAGPASEGAFYRMRLSSPEIGP